MKVARMVPLLLLAACGGGEASIALVFPNEQAHGAAAEIALYAYPKDSAGIGVEVKCSTFLGRLRLGEPLIGDPIDNPFEPPFDNHRISGFPKGDPVIVVVAYNSRNEDKKPILEGCTDVFDTSGNSTEVEVKLEVIVPDEVRLVKVAGDRQVGHPGKELEVPLTARVEAALPGRREDRYPLPGLELEFTPDMTVALPPNAAGAKVVAATNASGEASTKVVLPAGSAERKVTVVAVKVGMQTRQIFTLSAIEPVTVARTELIAAPPGSGTPVAVAVGNVTGGDELDAVVLSCVGSADGCKPGAEAKRPVGESRMTVISDVLGRRMPGMVMAPPSGLGVAPGGLFVGPLVPGSHDDIAIVNSRRAACQPRECEGSEVIVFKGDQNAVTFEAPGALTLTASNAIGLAGYKARAADTYFSLLTAGQGRSENPRPCSRSTNCTPDDLPECAMRPQMCGCPPNERCECPPGLSCPDSTTPGRCIAFDKEIDVLSNGYNMGMTGRFENTGGCQRPRLTCAKTGQSSSGSTCECLDAFRGNRCSATEVFCGCKVPTKQYIGAFGAAYLPYGVTSGPLSMPAQYDVVVATIGGIGFMPAQTAGGFRWRTQPTVNAPVHGVALVDFDTDGILDLAFYARSPCNKEVNTVRQCPLARTLAAGKEEKGCLGVYLRGEMAPEAVKEGGCRRFSLEFAPDGMCTGDFNGDQKSDLAISSASISHVAVYLGDGRGGVLDPPDMLMLPAGAVGGPIACKDLDGDGKDDIVVARRSNGDVIVLRSGS